MINSIKNSFFFVYASWKYLSLLYLLIILISFAMANINIKRNPPNYLVSAALSYQSEVLETIFISIENNEFKNCIENYSQFFAFELLRSNEVSKIIFKDKELIRNLFISEWNPTAYRFEKPHRQKSIILISDLKYFLTGWRPTYIKPDVARLREKLSGLITIIGKDSFSTIYLINRTLDPKTSINIMRSLLDAFNQILVDKCKSSHLSWEQGSVDTTARSLKFKKMMSEKNNESKFIDLIFDEKKIKIYDFILDPHISEFSRKVDITTYYIYAFLLGTFVFLFTFFFARIFIYRALHT